MKKYRAWAKMTSWLYLDVEAESEDEAWEIASEADGGEFEENTIDCSWEITEIEEV